MYYNLIGLLIYAIAVVYVKNVEFNDTPKETPTRGEIITNTVIDTVYIKEKPQQEKKAAKPAIKL